MRLGDIDNEGIIRELYAVYGCDEVKRVCPISRGAHALVVFYGFLGDAEIMRVLIGKSGRVDVIVNDDARGAHGDMFGYGSDMEDAKNAAFGMLRAIYAD